MALKYKFKICFEYCYHLTYEEVNISKKELQFFEIIN